MRYWFKTATMTTPRDGVRKALTEKIGFKSFQNFVATDDQLASEMLSELALRDVDFTEPDNHLVLLSEGDNFYAQVLSLTYATELAKRTSNKANAGNRSARTRKKAKPKPILSRTI